MYNLGADQDRAGVIVDMSLGNLKKAGNWFVKGIYRNIEADSAMAAYALRMTPVTNYTIKIGVLGYALTDKDTITGIIAFPKRIVGPEKGWTYGALCYTHKF